MMQALVYTHTQTHMLTKATFDLREREREEEEGEEEEEVVVEEEEEGEREGGREHCTCSELVCSLLHSLSVAVLMVQGEKWR